MLFLIVEAIQLLQHVHCNNNVWITILALLPSNKSWWLASPIIIGSFHLSIMILRLMPTFINFPRMSHEWPYTICLFFVHCSGVLTYFVIQLIKRKLKTNKLHGFFSRIAAVSHDQCHVTSWRWISGNTWYIT